MAQDQARNNVSFTAKPSLLEALGSEVLTGRDSKALAKASLAYLHRYLRAETSMVCLSNGDKLAVAAVVGPHARRLAKSKFLIEGACAGLLRGEPRSILIPDAAAGGPSGGDMPDRLRDLGARSILMVAVGGAGLIALADSEVDVFTSFDQAGVTGIAVQLDYVLGARRREGELEGSLDNLKALLDSIGKGQATGDLSEAVQATVAAIINRTGSDNGSFLLLDKDTGRFALTASVGLGGSLENVEIAPGEGIAGWVAAHGKPLSVSDVKGVSASGKGGKTAAALSLPVTVGKDVLGVLNLGSKRAGHKFVLDDLDHLISTLARIAAGMAAERSKDQWRALYFETVRALSRVIESRNPFNLGHSAEVASVAKRLAANLGVVPGQVDPIELAALLHDVGVAAFADDVLGAERPLNSAERLILRSHPAIGRNALADIEQLREVLPIILHHHENFDGTGYVEGLAGERIPLGARILAVAEAYAAMTHDRPHRPAKSHSEALAELRAGAGKQFDPEIVAAFEALKAAKP